MRRLHPNGEPATPNLGDEVHLTFEGQTYKVAIVDKEAIVSGGEPDRLLAFFDAQDRLNVVSTGTMASRRLMCWLTTASTMSISHVGSASWTG